MRSYNGSKKYDNIWRGSYESDCQYPCKATQFHGRTLLFQPRKDAAYSVLSFTLNQVVMVTESYIPQFSLSNFLAELGGSLGLWLGVGAVQLLISGAQLGMEMGSKMTRPNFYA